MRTYVGALARAHGIAMAVASAAAIAVGLLSAAPTSADSAAFLSPTGTVSIPSGGSKLVTVAVRNDSGSTWTRMQDNLHFVDPQGHDLTYPYCGSDPRWVNGTTVFMTEASVAAGGTAHFPVPVCGQAGYVGSATLRLQYVREGVAHYAPIFPMSLYFYAPSDPGPPSAKGAFEPNDSFDAAYGPLVAGNAYGAQLETDNDVDFYRFYTDRPTQLNIEAVNSGDDECSAPGLELFDNRHEQIDYDAGVQDSTKISYSTEGPGAFFLRLDSRFNSCPPLVSEYVLTVQSSAPLVANVDGFCKTAQTRIQKFNRKLGKTTSPRKKAKLRKKRRKAKALAAATC